MAEVIPQEVAETTRCLKLGHLALQVDAIEAPNRQCHVIPDNAVDVGRHATLLGGKVDDGTLPRERRSSHRSQHQTAAQRPMSEGSPESRRSRARSFSPMMSTEHNSYLSV
jgi:hypothetical protein